MKTFKASEFVWCWASSVTGVFAVTLLTGNVDRALSYSGDIAFILLLTWFVWGKRAE